MEWALRYSSGVVWVDPLTGAMVVEVMTVQGIKQIVLYNSTGTDPDDPVAIWWAAREGWDGG